MLNRLYSVLGGRKMTLSLIGTAAASVLVSRGVDSEVAWTIIAGIASGIFGIALEDGLRGRSLGDVAKIVAIVRAELEKSAKPPA